MKRETSPLTALGRERLEAMRTAGEEILECRRVLLKGGLNVVGEMLRGQGEFVEYEHYPADDVFDAETHAQYYYHAHRGSEGEHGHFHTFLRAPGMPAGVVPVPYGGEEPWPSGDEALSHLIAVSMDAYGEPIGLFTVNRWVTGDAWYAAADVIRMLERFEIDHANPSWPANRWLGAMLRLFRPQIEALVLARDVAVADWARAHPATDVFEDRELEITSQLAISVEAQIAAVAAALGPLPRKGT
ncbi:MAG: hypothetical protein KF766_10390 [Rhodocyclaceae bacterium]|nr:hypothetical protein [Rhodocyclaceae bacterium]MCB1891007.1 hypothetical protein [Rhodocyclaceae bacterium]